MLNVCIRPQPAVPGVPALAVTAGETSSDEILVERIAAGNKLAMQALFARHRTSVYRWLLRFVSNETLAEDLLSEVFLDVWRQAGRFECRSSVSTWLMSIARHKALSARRRRTEGAELDEKIEATIADPANNPEVALQEKDRSELVRRALIRLSAEHRQVIDLVYYHEKSVDEVAHILDVPPATVKTRMFYARKKLAELVTGGKLCTMMYAYELDRRLRARRSSVQSIAFDPGLMVETGLVRSAPPVAQRLMRTSVMKTLFRMIGITMGSTPFSGDVLAKLAIDPAFAQASGKYIQSHNGRLIEARSSTMSYDERRARKLWSDSETLVGLRP